MKRRWGTECCGVFCLIPKDATNVTPSHGGGGGGKWGQGVLGSPCGVPIEEGMISHSHSSQFAAGAMRGVLQAAVAGLGLHHSDTPQPSLISSGFQAASKFLRSQILPGAARSPGQQWGRAVSVPTAQPGLLVFRG